MSKPFRMQSDGVSLRAYDNGKSLEIVTREPSLYHWVDIGIQVNRRSAVRLRDFLNGWLEENDSEQS